MESISFNNRIEDLVISQITSKQDKQWTDDDGIIVQATALIMGRSISIVGSVDYSGQNDPINVIEGGPGSENHPPLTIAYLQGTHFQSLCSAATITPLGSSSESTLSSSSTRKV